MPDDSRTEACIFVHASVFAQRITEFVANNFWTATIHEQEAHTSLFHGFFAMFKIIKKSYLTLCYQHDNITITITSGGAEQ